MEELNPYAWDLFFGGNLPRILLITTSCFTLGLLSWLMVCFLAPAQAAGPLSVGSNNPRFFIDPTGKAVYLTSDSLVDRSDKAALDCAPLTGEKT